MVTVVGLVILRGALEVFLPDGFAVEGYRFFGLLGLIVAVAGFSSNSCFSRVLTQGRDWPRILAPKIEFFDGCGGCQLVHRRLWGPHYYLVMMTFGAVHRAFAGHRVNVKISVIILLGS